MFCFFPEVDSGVRRSDLVNWYLKEIEADIESEAELVDKEVLVEKVVYRLVHHVSSTEFDGLPDMWKDKSGKK